MIIRKLELKDLEEVFELLDELYENKIDHLYLPKSIELV